MAGGAIWGGAAQTFTTTGFVGTLATTFTLSSGETVDKIWYYSPTGSVGLPSAVAIYDNTGAQVAGSLISSPSWSGAAGSGWISTQYGSGPTLSNGISYSVAYFTSSSGMTVAYNGYTWPTSVGVIDATGAGYSSTTTAISNPASSAGAYSYYVDISFTSGGVSGTGSVQLPKMTVAASGGVLVSGTGSVQLPKMKLAGSGGVLVAGTGSVQLPKMKLAGSGGVLVAGTGSVQLPKMTVAGSGGVLVAGSGGVILPKMSVAGSGIVTSGPSGTGGVTLPKMTVVASGGVLVSGSGSVILPKMTVAATGFEPVTATGSVRLPKMTVAGAQFVATQLCMKIDSGSAVVVAVPTSLITARNGLVPSATATVWQITTDPFHAGQYLLEGWLDVPPHFIPGGNSGG